jgi:small subunit ribosomal protein S2
MAVVSLADLLESGVHFGHQTRRWNPKMDQYIFTARNGVHIIDLVQTAQLLDEAYEYTRNAAEQGKKFLFVGTKRQAAGIIAQEAFRCGASYVNQRWLGGMLTNWETIKSRAEYLKELEELEESGAINKRPKKEGAVLRRELGKLQKYLGGIKNMRRIPDIVVIVDQRREYNAIQECQKLGIPVISLLDTNCDPDLVDIPIPANDDAIRSIKLILGKLADAIYEGRHGQLESEEDYEEFEEGLEEDIDYEDEEEGEEESSIVDSSVEEGGES